MLTKILAFSFLLVVAFTIIGWLNTPKLNRTRKTLGLYILGASGFALACVVIYFIVR